MPKRRPARSVGSSRRFRTHGRPETLEPRALLSINPVMGSAFNLAPSAETSAEMVQTANAPAALTAANFTSLEDMRAWITQQATERYGELFDSTLEHGLRPWYRYYTTTDAYFLSDLIDDDRDGVGDTDGFGFVRNQGIGDSEGSNTNVQVEGVDEADLIETDGEFLYVLSGDELIIVDARDPEDLSIASRVELGYTPSGMYLSGDRLTLVAESRYRTLSPSNGLSLAAADDVAVVRIANVPLQTVTVTPVVTVTVLDVTDREAPTQVERTEIDGRLVSSRMVDGQLRLVTQRAGAWTLPTPTYSVVEPDAETGPAAPDALAAGANTIQANHPVTRYVYPTTTYQYESLDEYVDRVVDQWLPTYRTLSAEGEVLSEANLIEPTEIARPYTGTGSVEFVAPGSYGNGTQLTTIATFDVHDNEAGPTGKATLATGGAAQLYATGDNLYVFSQSYQSSSYYNYGVSTEVRQFSFGSAGEVSLEATGQIEGRLLNQFAADEYDGHLRVVTTTGWNRDQKLTVLQKQADSLVEVGAVESLAPGEELHSVRFIGEVAYVVTFRKVDPLFSIDLSDPATPSVEGVLKIPGYSDYLQPLEEGYLIGVGRGADEARGLFEEMQVSIFDVTELGDPQLIHRHSIDGGRNTTSVVTGDQWAEGDGDHHAFSYYADAGVLALPIEHQYGGGWGENPEGPLFDPGEGGLLVLSVDVTAGFSELALIEHDTPIHRSLRIGDTLLAISAGQVSTHDLTNPSVEYDTLDLETGMAIGLAGFRLPGIALPTATVTAESVVAVVGPPAPEGIGYVPLGDTVQARSVVREGRATPVGATASSTHDAALLLLLDGPDAGDPQGLESIGPEREATPDDADGETAAMGAFLQTTFTNSLRSAG